MRVVFLTVLLAFSMSPAGCSDALDPDEVLTASITTSDSTILAGESVTVQAAIVRRSGPDAPDTVVWTVSDPEVLAISAEPDGRALVTGLRRGRGYVVALVHNAFVDSVDVRVVESGDVRWRRALGEGGLGQLPVPALDGHGRVFVVQFDVGPIDHNLISAYSPRGAVVLTVPTCRGTGMSPSVSHDGTSFVSGSGCTRQHAADGSIDWAVPFGTFDGGLAVASDGSVLILFDIWNGESAEGHVALSRIFPDGTEAWRDTLGPSSDPNLQKTAPSIGPYGDVYVAWRAEAGSWLSRISADGIVHWTVPLPGWSKRSSPAIWNDRVAVTYTGPGGLAVYDSSGAQLWARSGLTGPVSSPVIDPEGTLYVQSSSSLTSHDSGGTPRWSADSLSCRACLPFGAGAPTLMAEDQLVVQCGWADVCAARRSDGSLIWRSKIGGEPDGPIAVASDGTIYVVAKGDKELVALWNRVPPLIEGWPTEGGGMQRLRRR